MADDSPKGKKMVKIAKTIQEGAKTFLVTEYKYLTIFCLVFAVILCIIFSTTPIEGGNDLDGVRYAGCFLAGAALSAMAGWRGMAIATDSNVRTSHAASKDGLSAALKIAFAGGSVMGFTVVGLGIVGLSVFFVAMSANSEDDSLSPMAMSRAFQYLTGFGFGASAIALFARVAGGIYTKAADVGADLVGKVEEGLAEDHANNPAVIADNVGDNVGDVAGMGADLFESYVGSIIAAGSLATPGDTAMLAYPFWIAGSGIVAAAVGAQCVSANSADQKVLLRALGRGVWISSALVLAFSAVITWAVFGNTVVAWKRFGCVAIGLVAGVVIGEATEYFTSFEYAPVKSITSSARTGSATVIIQGLGIGMLSCLPPAIVIVITIIACDTLAQSYGVAIAAVGMLSTLGVTLATDAAGPIVLGGLLFGAVLPFVFAALTMLSVRKAAALIILEVRRQFQKNPMLKDKDYEPPTEAEGPDYKECIDISTRSSVEEMILPGGLAILTPLFIGFLVGPKCLSGMLAGAIASGFMLAVMMSNAGGAWDNAKKYVELNEEALKIYGGKGTDVHNATVVGDTVGDPFKDTSGPALNILIKLMSMVSLVFAPLMHTEDWHYWYIGLVILAVMIVLSVVVYSLYWKGFEAKIEQKSKEFDDYKKAQAAKPAEAIEMAAAKETDTLLADGAVEVQA